MHPTRTYRSSIRFLVMFNCFEISDIEGKDFTMDTVFLSVSGPFNYDCR